MSPRISKSKNLDKYPYFLPYDSPTNIPFNKIANKLGVHPNLLRGMMRSARSHSTIYTALVKKGYKDHQIPGWFARPNEPLVYRRAATAGPQVSAEKRSGAEARSEPITGYTSPTIDVVQKGSAERPSELSVRSAPPAGVYRLVQPEYRPPLDPMVEEALRQIREIQDEDLRDSLEWRKRRRDPPKPVSPDVTKARAEVLNLMQQIEAWNAFQMMFWMNVSQAGRVAKPIDVEELKEIFTRPFEEMRLKNERQAKEYDETFAAVGEMLKDCVPQIGPPDDWMQRYEAAVQRKEEREREAWVNVGKFVADNPKRRNFELEMIEYQNRQIIENFYKDINRMRAR